MKATGQIRRIDDLGRVVVPKEVRVNLGIRVQPVDLAWLSDSGLLCSEIHGGSGERSPRKAESSHIQDKRRQLAGAC